jgi:hypothetical protein
MAHQQGLAAALKILTADRNSSIEDVVGASAARHNAMGGMTVALAIGKFDALVRSNEDEARNLLTVGTPTSAVTGRIPAGAAPTQFPISASHFLYIYILPGLANRMSNRLDAPLVYFDRNEMVPRIGDLIGCSRTAGVRNRADLERLLLSKFFPSKPTW